MNETESKVIDAMKIYGGSFVRALAEAYTHADPYNRGKIRATWSEYWETYIEMSRK